MKKVNHLSKEQRLALRAAAQHQAPVTGDAVNTEKIAPKVPKSKPAAKTAEQPEAEL